LIILVVAESNHLANSDGREPLPNALDALILAGLVGSHFPEQLHQVREGLIARDLVRGDLVVWGPHRCA
jgi:hypothetical protein